MTAEELLKQWPAEELVRAARGGIDLNEMAHFELARRGINRMGEEVGEVAASQEWNRCWGGEPPKLRDFCETPAEDWESLCKGV